MSGISDRRLERARAQLEQYMVTTVQFKDEDGEVLLTSKCRYQPTTKGVSRETSQAVFLYRDVRLQLPWDTDVRGIVPDTAVVVIDSDNIQLIGRTMTVRWVQDSDIVLERTILTIEDSRDYGG